MFVRQGVLSASAGKVLLQRVECSSCHWHATGSVMAVEIAASAHRCLLERKEGRLTAPPDAKVEYERAG